MFILKNNKVHDQQSGTHSMDLRDPDKGGKFSPHLVDGVFQQYSKNNTLNLI